MPGLKAGAVSRSVGGFRNVNVNVISAVSSSAGIKW